MIRLHPNHLLLPAVLFGLGMVLLGALLTGVLRGQDLNQSWYPARPDILAELSLGVGLGLLGVGVVDVLGAFVPPLRRLMDKITQVLDFATIRPWHALVFGLLASIPEEILFRGSLQPITGLLLAALLFGVAHAITPLYMLYAACAGLFLGGLSAWRGDLWAATAAHAAYDAALFWLIARRVRASSVPGRDTQFPSGSP